MRIVTQSISEFTLFIFGLFESVVITRPRLLDVLNSTERVLSIGWRPVVIVSIPIGMTFALNFDSLLGLVGLRSFAASGLVPAIVREAGPLFAGVVAAATVGAAFASDIGARKVRDEIAGSEVMSVDPRSRLYLPRIVGSMLGLPVLSIFATISALIGGWILIVILRSGSGGQYLAGFDAVLRVDDMIALLIKSVLYGLIVGISACYCGSRAAGGPSGVANATRKSIIASFTVIALADFIVNQFFYAP